MLKYIVFIGLALVSIFAFQNCANQNPSQVSSQDVIENEDSTLIEVNLENEMIVSAKTAAMTTAPAAPKCITLNSKYVSKLNNVYIYDTVRVFYSTDKNNVDAVANLTDKNKNNYPDYVEDIARQIVITRAALNDLGFMDPLRSPRYKAYGVQFIDVHVRKLDGNGLAFDEPVIYGNNPLKKGACTLHISLANNLNDFPGGWTVASHELFHLYEYGYTMFKASWFLEGLAAWSERVIRLGALRSNGLAPLPADAKQMNDQVYTVPYNFLWDRLSYLSETYKDKNIAVNPAIVDRTYVDGSKIFRDQKLWGVKIIKSVLESMAAESNAVSNEKGWSRFTWTEAEQKNPANNPRMLNAIQRAVSPHLGQSPEVDNFLKLK